MMRINLVFAALFIILMWPGKVTALSCAIPLDSRSEEEQWAGAFETQNLIGLFEVVDRNKKTDFFRIIGGEQVVMELKPLKVFKGKMRKSHRWAYTAHAPLEIGERYLIAFDDFSGKSEGGLCKQALWTHEYRAPLILEYLKRKEIIYDASIEIEPNETSVFKNALCSVLTDFRSLSGSKSFQKFMTRTMLALSCLAPTTDAVASELKVIPIPALEKLDPVRNHCQNCYTAEHLLYKIPLLSWPQIDVVQVSVEIPAGEMRKLAQTPSPPMEVRVVRILGAASARYRNNFTSLRS